MLFLLLYVVDLLQPIKRQQLMFHACALGESQTIAAAHRRSTTYVRRPFTRNGCRLALTKCCCGCKRTVHSWVRRRRHCSLLIFLSSPAPDSTALLQFGTKKSHWLFHSKSLVSPLIPTSPHVVATVRSCLAAHQHVTERVALYSSTRLANWRLSTFQSPARSTTAAQCWSAFPL